MEPKLNCSTSTIKYILFFCNFVFLAGGIAVVVIGSIITVGIADYDEFLTDPVAAPGILLITTGAIVIVTGFLGCCGALKQSHWMLFAYAGCLGVIFLAQFVGGILAFAFQSELGVILKNQMEDQLKLYDDNENGDNARYMWDKMQTDFQCCGVESFSDWQAIGGMSDPPKSCGCADLTSENCNPLGWYAKGCYYDFVDHLVANQTALGIIALVFAVAELGGIAFALIVAYAIKRNVGLPAYAGKDGRPYSQRSYISE